MENPGRKRKNYVTVTARNVVSPHRDSTHLGPHLGREEASHYSPGRAVKKPRRTHEEKQAADRVYQQARRTKKAELDAPYVQIDTSHDTLIGSLPSKPSKETKELTSFRQSLFESVQRCEGAPPTRCVVDQDSLAALAKFRSAVAVQAELTKCMIRTAAPEQAEQFPKRRRSDLVRR